MFQPAEQSVPHRETLCFTVSVLRVLSVETDGFMQGNCLSPVMLLPLRTGLSREMPKVIVGLLKIKLFLLTGLSREMSKVIVGLLKIKLFLLTGLSREISKVIVELLKIKLSLRTGLGRESIARLAKTERDKA